MARTRITRRRSPKSKRYGGFAGIGVFLLIFAVVNLIGFNNIADFFGLNEPLPVSRAGEGTVQVHYIDVGQGDCALILTESQAVLIDGGDVQYADAVIGYLRRMEVERLDLIIVSHNHADHMGGMDKIIAAVNPERLLMPRVPDSMIPTSGVFERMLDAIERYSVNAGYAAAGDVIDIGGAVIEVLAPYSGFEPGNLNDSSIVARLVHGDNSFLFTGDMERAAEDDLFARGVDISADVLKVSHHGSNSSSQRQFIERVGGSYAVISVGSPNRYNHPAEQAVGRLEVAGYEVLRTDELGTIVFVSDVSGRLSRGSA